MSAARSLADELRGRDRQGLVRLFEARGDLVVPRPADLGEVIERAGSRPSTALAIDALDRWQRRVAEALAALGPTPITALAKALGVPQPAVSSAVAELRDRALVWSRTPQLTSAAVAALGPFPAGLAPPSATPLTDDQIEAALAEADAEEHQVLQRLVWQPHGQLRGARRPVGLTSDSGPAQRLLARRLLRPWDDDHVVLCREVALHLRDGALFAEAVSPEPAPWPSSTSSGATNARIVDSAGLGTAVHLVGQLADLAEQIADEQPSVLASGGMARKALNALVEANPGAPVRLLLGLAEWLQLVAPEGRHWLCTPLLDRWVSSDPWPAWLQLSRAWPQLDRWPLEPGTDPVLPATRPATALRQVLVGQVLQAPAASVVSAEVLAERTGWFHPLWPDDQVHQAASQVVAEAEQLGVLAMGTRVSWLPQPGAEGTGQYPDAQLPDPGFPEPSGQIVVQSDLSVLVPGPLDAPTRSMLAQISEREPGSRRFTPASVRRGLDAGLGAEALLAWIEEHSMTGVPQPLRYLVDDAARSHGRIQVMAAASVVLLDDPIVAEALVRHPRATELGLTRVGPSAIVSQADPVEVLEVLQELGHSPSARAADGSTVHAPPPRRARPHRPQSAHRGVGRDQLEALATALLQSQAAASSPGRTDELLDQLRQAQRSGEWIQLTHVDDRGRPIAERARVLRVGQGTVRIVARASAPRQLSITRVVGVSPSDT